MVFAWDESLDISDSGNLTWEVFVSNKWNGGTRPSGGYLMALGVQAISKSLPYKHPFTATCHFLSAAVEGPATIVVEPLREGRTLATASGSMWQNGKRRIHVVATLGDLGEVGVPRYSLEPPYLPAPDNCIRALGRLPTGIVLPITNHVEMRFGAGSSVAADGVPSGNSEIAAWFRLDDGRPPDASTLFLAADAFLPAILELGMRTWSPTIELTVHVRARPSPGWLRILRRTNIVSHGYGEEDSEMWDEEDTLVAQSRQLLRLGTPVT